MQDYSLTVDRFLDHAATWHGRRLVVTGTGQAGDVGAGYATIRDRANRLSGALLDLGLRPGEKLATLAWNTQHHLEVWYAAMGVGVVCHTLNPRLTTAHLAAMVNEAGDRILFVGGGLGTIARALLDACPCLERLILLDGDEPEGGASVPTDGFETLLARHGRSATWGGFDEGLPAGLCFTSGTTGAPKGVLYTHRSNYLNTLRMMQADTLGLTAEDTILVAVPMFHANAWGIPFAAPAVGASMVLPGRDTSGAALEGLINRHGVTVATGVPTVWLGLLDHLDATGGDVPSLTRVISGGSSIPDALLARIEDRLGVTVQTSWGMTELSPLGAISPPTRRPRSAIASGTVPMGLELRLTDADGAVLADQRNAVGHLKVRGPSVVRRYLGAADPAIDAEGWFDTGDLALIDDDGHLTIAGRSKDLIKSGGEWINPGELEAIVGTLPSVGLVAVIGREDPKWGERPLMVIEARRGETIDTGDVVASLKGRVADWWIPDRIVTIDAMPLAATGKINKVALRAIYGAAGL
jgi:acyl-CoA synthetase (AMP-forming)/AMP-acid ligase II